MVTNLVLRDPSTFYCQSKEAWMQDVFSMDANQDMVNYFSQPKGRIDPQSFPAIYCLNPLSDDGCPVGLCPNPDIAGSLVRIASYITAFCLTILIFHAPKRVKEVFYFQISNVFAGLVTCSVSLFRADITRFHATIATFMAASPVSVYFIVYSIRAFWGNHRLDTVLGRKDYLNRGLVFLAVGIWISIIIFTSLDSTQDRFTQSSCLTSTTQQIFLQQGFLGAPTIIASIAALSFSISVFLARREIWPPGEKYRPKFAKVWKTIGRRYPFVFFMSIGIAPMSLWIWTIEAALNFNFYESDTTMDTVFSFSFGQILALFIAVPPLLQVCLLLPRLWPWITNLPWYPRGERRGKQPLTIHGSGPSYEMVHSKGFEHPAPPAECEGSQVFQEGGRIEERGRIEEGGGIEEGRIEEERIEEGRIEEGGIEEERGVEEGERVGEEGETEQGGGIRASAIHPEPFYGQAL